MFDPFAPGTVRYCELMEPIPGAFFLVILAAGGNSSPKVLSVRISSTALDGDTHAQYGLCTKATLGRRSEWVAALFHVIRMLGGGRHAPCE